MKVRESERISLGVYFIIIISIGLALGIPTWRLPLAVEAQVPSAYPYAYQAPNDPTTGTTQFSLTKINASGNAVIMASTDTNGYAGICISNCSTTGSAWIAYAGLVPVTMENTATAQHYVNIGSTTGGDGHDSGATTYPTGTVVGRIQVGAAAAAKAMVLLFPPEIQGVPAGAVSSFSGDGVLLINSLSSGAVTATVGNATAHKYWGNNTGSSTTAAFQFLGTADVSPAWYGTGAGSVNVMTANFVPAPPALAIGMTFYVLPNLNNTTTTPTFNAQSLGAKTITKYGAQPLAAGDYITSAIAVFIYDGTHMQLQNPQTAANGATSTVGSADQTAQAANISATTLFTPASNGLYTVSCYAAVTQAATTSSALPACAVLWTDADTSVAQAVIITNGPTGNTVGIESQSALGTIQPAPAIIYAGAGTPIQYRTQGYSSVGATPLQYSVHVRVNGPF